MSSDLLLDKRKRFLKVKLSGQHVMDGNFKACKRVNKLSLCSIKLRSLGRASGFHLVNGTKSILSYVRQDTFLTILKISDL